MSFAFPYLIFLLRSFTNRFEDESSYRFDQNISKGGEGKKVMIFSDSRTNPSEEGEDDKNHGVPNEPIAKKIQKMSWRSKTNMSTTDDKIRNNYKGNKIRITLLIEYLKARTLFEIKITPQARSIMSSLNDSCWSNISNTCLRFESLHKQDWSYRAWMILHAI